MTEPFEDRPDDPRHEAVQLLAEAIADHHPVMAVTGPAGGLRAAVVEAVIDSLQGQPVGFLRIAGEPQGPLTVARVLTQICGEAPADAQRASSADQAARIMQALQARRRGEGQIVLVVDQAETLVPPAIRLLHVLTRIADPSLPVVQVLFVGTPAFSQLIQDQPFTVLRSQLAAFVTLPDDAPAPSGGLPPALAVAPDSRLAAPSDGRRRRAAPRGRMLGGMAAAVAVLAGLLYASTLRPVPAPVAAVGQDTAPQDTAPRTVPVAPETRTALPAPVPTSPVPTSPAPTVPVPNTPRLATPIAPPAASPAPAPRAAERDARPPVAQTPIPDPAPASGAGTAATNGVSPATRRQLRTAFETFLRQTRGDIASLSAAQRDALFEQYLAEYMAMNRRPEPAQDRPTPAPTQPFTPAPTTNVPPSPPRAQAPEPPAQESRQAPRLRVVIHYRAASTAARVAASHMSAMIDDDHARTELRPVEAVPSAAAIRYYNPEDREPARRLADTLAPRLAADMAPDEPGFAVQDFSSYRPRPSPGTLEVWLPPS